MIIYLKIGGVYQADLLRSTKVSMMLLREFWRMKQITQYLYGTFGVVDCDPRMRIVSTSYMSLIDKNQLDEEICENASCFHIHVLEDENTIDITLENGNEELKVKVACKKATLFFDFF